MSNVPTLSYKKPSEKGQTHKTQLSESVASSSTDSVLSTPIATRKVSRRKALQDFYKIESEGNGDENLNATPLHEQDLDKFLQTSSIVDILKLRNTISGTQSSQDLEKKEIIYNNYYELIKLNDTLNNLSNPSLKKDDKILSTETISDTYVDETLEDLSGFLSNTASKFSDDLKSVLKNLNQHEADDDASVTGIVENTPIVESTVDKIQLINEINMLLAGNIDKSVKPTIELDIQSILKNLSVKQDDLLILQLNDIKRKLSIT